MKKNPKISKYLFENTKKITLTMTMSCLSKLDEKNISENPFDLFQ